MLCVPIAAVATLLVACPFGASPVFAAEIVAPAAGVESRILVATGPHGGDERVAAGQPTNGQLQVQARVGEGDREGRGEEGGEAEHAEHTPSIDLKKLALQFLNFAVLLFILIKFGGGAINKALAARHQQLKADLASAAELRAIAEAKLGRQEARLASLENEIADMRRGIKAEAEAEKSRLIAAAEERASRIKTETAFMVDQQVREAEVRLRRESADTALKVAEEILRRAIGTGDQQRLLDTFVTDVEQPIAEAVKSAERMT
jgi:F-type H+-transporting ATPase subunit b